MYQNRRILGIITARGGSKGIPRKNIKELAGKPLIAYTIEATKTSQYLTRTIISTDDQTIAEIAKQYGVEVPFMRPAELAQDDSTSLDVVNNALDWLEKNVNEKYDYVMILQPTSPLRSTKDIDGCIKKAVDTDVDSVMSVMELDDFSVKKLKVIKDDIIEPWLDKEGTFSATRQSLEKVYKRNCAIYLTKTKFIRQNDLFGKISRPYIMPRERSIDINQLVDFELAEFWLQKLKDN